MAHGGRIIKSDGTKRIVFGYVFFVSAVFYLISGIAQGIDIGAIITMQLTSGLGGCLLLIFGYKARSRAIKQRKYIQYIINHKQINIDSLSQFMKVKPQIVIKDLQNMLDTGLFSGAYIDKDSRQFVYAKETENPNMHSSIVKCLSCGANNTVIAGATFNECEYCGSPIAVVNKNHSINHQIQMIDANIAQKLKVPITKKWWFWIIAIFLFINIFSRALDNEVISEEAESSKHVIIQISSQTQISSNQYEIKTYGINNTVVLKTLKIEANEIKESNGQYLKPAEGNIFVGVKFTVENISNKDLYVNRIELFDTFVDGVKCELSSKASITFDEGSLDGTVPPGKKLIGIYAVEVSQDWEELELHVRSSWLGSEKVIFIFNKDT